MTTTSNKMPSSREEARRVLMAIHKIAKLVSTIPTNYKELRQAAGLTQEHAAYVAGVSLRTWVAWEHDRAKPMSHMPLKKLCEYIIAQHKSPPHK